MQSEKTAGNTSTGRSHQTTNRDNFGRERKLKANQRILESEKIHGQPEKYDHKMVSRTDTNLRMGFSGYNRYVD